MDDFNKISKDQKRRKKMKLRRTQDLISMEDESQQHSKLKKSIKKAKKSKVNVALPQVNDLFYVKGKESKCPNMPLVKDSFSFKTPKKIIKSPKVLSKVHCVGQSWIVEALTDVSDYDNVSLKSTCSSEVKQKASYIKTVEDMKPCYVLLDKLKYDNNLSKENSFEFFPSNSSSPIFSQQKSFSARSQSSLTKELFEHLPNCSIIDGWCVENVTEQVKDDFPILSKKNFPCTSIQNQSALVTGEVFANLSAGKSKLSDSSSSLEKDKTEIEKNKSARSAVKQQKRTRNVFPLALTNSTSLSPAELKRRRVSVFDTSRKSLRLSNQRSANQPTPELHKKQKQSLLDEKLQFEVEKSQSASEKFEDVILTKQINSGAVSPTLSKQIFSPTSLQSQLPLVGDKISGNSSTGKSKMSKLSHGMEKGITQSFSALLFDKSEKNKAVVCSAEKKLKKRRRCILVSNDSSSPSPVEKKKKLFVFDSSRKSNQYSTNQQTLELHRQQERPLLDENLQFEVEKCQSLNETFKDEKKRLSKSRDFDESPANMTVTLATERTNGLQNNSLLSSYENQEKVLNRKSLSESSANIKSTLAQLNNSQSFDQLSITKPLKKSKKAINKKKSLLNVTFEKSDDDSFLLNEKITQFFSPREISARKSLIENSAKIPLLKRGQTFGEFPLNQTFSKSEQKHTAIMNGKVEPIENSSACKKVKENAPAAIQKRRSTLTLEDSITDIEVLKSLNNSHASPMKNKGDKRKSCSSILQDKMKKIIRDRVRSRSFHEANLPDEANATFEFPSPWRRTQENLNLDIKDCGKIERSHISISDTDDNEIEIIKAPKSAMKSTKNYKDKIANKVTFNDRRSVILIEDSDNSGGQLTPKQNALENSSTVTPNVFNKNKQTPVSTHHKNTPQLFKKSIGLNHNIPSKGKNGTSVSKIKKVPDFAKIHQKMYEKMPDLKEYSEKKKERAKQLLSGHKLKQPEKATVSAISKKELFPQFNFSKLPVRTLISSTPKVHKITASTKEQRIKSVANRLPPAPNKNKFRQELKGVRSNKRFDLLMKMRSGKK